MPKDFHIELILIKSRQQQTRILRSLLWRSWIRTLIFILLMKLGKD